MPQVDDTAEQGWEERADAALVHLLRTGLAKSAKDASALSTAPQARFAPLSLCFAHVFCDRWVPLHAVGAARRL